MKRGIYIALSAMIICQVCFSRETGQITETGNHITIHQLFHDYGKKKNAIHVKIGCFAMTLTRIFEDTKGISGIEVYSLDNCSKETKNKFNDAIKKIKDKSYETLISTNKKNESVKILIKMKKDCVKEIVIVAGGNDPALVKIKGKIRPKDIQSIVDNHK
jgi:hypothetical protein